MSLPSLDIEGCLQELPERASIELLRAGDIPTPANATRIQHLPTQSECVQNAGSLCRAALAPVRRLPRELLIAIFMLALPDAWDEADVRATLNFAAVCFCWREVALAIPQFWANTCMTLDSRAGPIANRLERSAGRLRSVQIASGGQVASGVHAGAPNAEALRLVMSSASQWPRLVLPNFDQTMGALDAHWPGCFPLLMVLDLNCGHEVARAVRYFDNAPMLMMLNLHFLAINAPIEFPASSRLMSLELDFVGADGTLQGILPSIAACAPTIMRLVVRVAELGGYDQNFDGLMCPHLSDLTLVHGACYLSAYIVAPMLVKLAMKGQGLRAEPELYLRSATILVTRPQGVQYLRIFEIEGMNPQSPEWIVDCLSSMPSLSSLKIRDESRHDGTQVVVTMELLIMLTRTPDPYRLGFLPMLTGLELKCGGNAEVMYRDLVRILIITRRQYVDANLAPLCYVDTDLPLGAAWVNSPLPY
ncbi:hypothetical protein EV121DRAFT_286071 [Schizophyllum commune]